MTTMKRIISYVKDRIPYRNRFLRGVQTPLGDGANMVLVPVFTTTLRAVPLVTLLPRKQAFPAPIPLSFEIADINRFFNGHDPGNSRLAHEEILCGRSRKSAGMIEPDCKGLYPRNDGRKIDLLSLPSLKTWVRD
jgi:hypothetical protein